MALSPNGTHAMITTTAQSPALALLIAADAAFPRGAGDRNRIQALDDVLTGAIRCKAKFDVNDGPRIEAARINVNTCVGVFRPLDPRWYHEAAVIGGTYARMWEKHFDYKPFIAPEAWRGEYQETPLQKQRIVPGLAILLPETEQESGLQTFRGAAVWWCTNLDYPKDRVLLSRYRTEPSLNIRRPSEIRDPAKRTPARRKTITRAEWQALMDSVVVQREAAAA
jgi:hypothetical protein